MEQALKKLKEETEFKNKYTQECECDQYKCFNIVVANNSWVAAKAMDCLCFIGEPKEIQQVGHEIKGKYRVLLTSTESKTDNFKSISTELIN